MSTTFISHNIIFLEIIPFYGKVLHWTRLLLGPAACIKYLAAAAVKIIDTRRRVSAKSKVRIFCYSRMIQHGICSVVKYFMVILIFHVVGSSIAIPKTLKEREQFRPAFKRFVCKQHAKKAEPSFSSAYFHDCPPFQVLATPLERLFVSEVLGRMMILKRMKKL